MRKTFRDVLRLLVYPSLGIFIYFFSTELAYNLIYYRRLALGMDPAAIDSYIINNYYRMDSLAMFIGLILLLGLIALRTRSQEDYIYRTRPRARTWLVSILVLLGCKGLIDLIFRFLDFLASQTSFWAHYMEVFQEGPGQAAYNESYIYLVLSVVVLGPLVEELIFRGIFFRELDKVLGYGLGLVLSSLCFGIFHWDLIQLIYTFLIGLLLAYFYEKYRSIQLVFILHLINNLLETLPPILDDSPIYGYLNSLYLLMIIPGIYLIYREIQQDRRRSLF